MSKITLNNVGSLIDATTAAATINANSATIQTAMDNTLSRDGTQPNTMLNILDMNSNQIINLPAPATGNSPLRLTDASILNGGGTIAPVPSGGNTGDALVKNSNSNFDMKWAADSSLLTAGNQIVVTGTSPATVAVTATPTFTTVNTATIPTTVDTLVARNTTDTLTNKTLTSPTINTPTISSPTISSATFTGTTISGTIAGGSAAGSSLIVESTTNGSPSGDALNLSAGLVVLGPIGNRTGIISLAGPNGGGTTVNVGSAGNGVSAFNVYTAGGSPQQWISGGSSTQITFPTITDTLVTKTTTDTLTNKTYDALGTGNVLKIVTQPQGRLTFLTGTPIQTATTSGATSHFYTPYMGQIVPIYDGSQFVYTNTGGELSQTAADTTKSPAAVAANSAYDIFVWNDAGTIRATRGPAWTSVTVRSAGTALTRINGLYTNGVAITNGPAINRGTYVGTIASNGSSTFDWIVGAGASGGTAASLNCWNQYNRIDIQTTVTDTGGSYTYPTATVRQARASAGNQITFLSGNSEDALEIIYNSAMTSPAVASSGSIVGYGLDTTSAFSAQAVTVQTNSATALGNAVTGCWILTPQLGRHVLSANEAVNTSSAGTFNNSVGISIFNNTGNTFSLKFKM